MCGIVGVSGNLFAKHKKAFEDMLIFSQVRGPHSTGVASISYGSNQPFGIVKVLGRPEYLVDYDKRYDRVVDCGKKFILGHNRWATTGKITVSNAHPFRFDNIVGCHNGTIPEFRLKTLPKPFEDYGTDSEAVLANINEYPVEEVFKNLAGAWAFVWFDRRDNTVNMLRNNERDLYYTYSKDRQVLFWASERGFLAAALERNQIDRDSIREVTENIHFKWVVPEMNKAFNLPAQRRVKHDEWESSFPVQGRRFGSPNSCGLNSEEEPDGSEQAPLAQLPLSSTGTNVVDLRTQAWRGGKGASASVITNTSQPLQGTVIPPAKVVVKRTVKNFEHYQNLENFDGQGFYKKQNSKPLYRGWRGETINETQFTEKTNDGCAWCSRQATWGQPVRFVGPTEHICLECNFDDDVRVSCGLRG